MQRSSMDNLTDEGFISDVSYSTRNSFSEFYDFSPLSGIDSPLLSNLEYIFSNDDSSCQTSPTKSDTSVSQTDLRSAWSSSNRGSSSQGILQIGSLSLSNTQRPEGVPGPSGLQPIESQSNDSNSQNGGEPSPQRPDVPFQWTKSEPFKTCDLHRMEEKKFLCLTCQLNVCKKCLTERHQSCLFRPMPAFVQKRAYETLKDRHKYLCEMEQAIITNRVVFANRTSNVLTTAENYAIGLKSHIDHALNMVQQKIANAQKSKNETWSRQLELCNELLDNMTLWETRISSLTSFEELNRETLKMEQESMEMLTTPDDNVQFVAPSHRVKSLQSLFTVNLTPSPKNTTFVYATRGVLSEKNYCIVQVRDVLGEPCMTGGHSIISAVFRDNQIVESFVEDMNDGSYKIHIEFKEEGTHQVSVLLNEIPINSNIPLIMETGRECSFRNIIGPRVTLGTNGEKEGELCRPWGVGSDNLGRLIVADRSNHRIQIFKEDGTFVKSFGHEGQEPGQFLRPAGVAINQRNEIMVADKDNHRVQVFSPNGDFILQFGKQGSAPGDFNYPWDLAVNKGHIIVSDSKNHRIQEFTEKGEFLRQFGCQATLRQLDTPRSVCFTRDGTVLATDFNLHRVVCLSDNFEEISFFGSEGTGPKQFFRPQGITCDARTGRFAVCDSKNYRVQVFDQNGALLASIGTFGVGPKKFDCPQGVTFTQSGEIAVVDLNSATVQLF